MKTKWTFLFLFIKNFQCKERKNGESYHYYHKYFQQPITIEGDLESGFGYDFDFETTDKGPHNSRRTSIYVGAPLQQHSDGSRGAIHFSDYDTIDHRWIFPEQIPHKHFRRISLAGNHVINITTNFIGQVVKVSANEKRAFYTCDSQLQFNLKCDPVGTCYALTVSEPSVSESESVHFSDHLVQFGGCFFVRNIQKLLRNHSPRSLSPKFAQFWNPLVQMNLINNELVYSQRISLLDNPNSETSKKLISNIDFGGLDGQANFGYDLLVTKDRLIASAPGVGYGQGQLIKSMPLNQSHNQISNQTISVLPFKPDGPKNFLSQSEKSLDIDQSTVEGSSSLVTNEKPPTGLDHTLFGETIVSIQVSGKRMIATGIPKGKNSKRTSTGIVKIFYTDADWSRYFKNHVTLEGLIFMEHFGHGILVHDFNNDGLEDLIISAPFASFPRCPDCGRIYFFAQDENGGFSLVDFVTGKERFGRFGFSLDLMDLNDDGLLDVIATSPAGKMPSVYCITARPIDQGGFCVDQSEVIIAKPESLFGFKVKALLKPLGHYDAASLFVSSPLQSEISQYPMDNHYSYRVIINQSEHWINLQDKFCRFDPKLPNLPCGQFEICVKFLHQPTYLINPGCEYILNLKLDQSDQLILTNSKLSFQFKQDEIHQIKCTSAIAQLNQRKNNFNTAIIQVKEGELEDIYESYESYYDSNYEFSNSDESYSANSCDEYRVSIGCSIPPIKFHFFTGSHDQPQPKVELHISEMPNASFFINITTDWPIIGGVLTLTNQQSLIPFVLNSNIGKKWTRLTKFHTENRLDTVQKESHIDSVSILFQKPIDREKIGDFLFTLDGHNFNTVSKIVQPKLIDEPIFESLTASSDIVLGSSFDNAVGIKKPIRVWFDANRKLANRKSFELEIGTPACIFDSKTNQWQRFISTKITHNSALSCSRSFCDEGVDDDIPPNTIQESADKQFHSLKCNSTLIKCDFMICHVSNATTSNFQNWSSPIIQFELTFSSFKFIVQKYSIDYFIDYWVKTGSQKSTNRLRIRVSNLHRKQTVMDSVLLIPVWMSISTLILGIGLVTFIGFSLNSYGFFEPPNKKSSEEKQILSNGNNNHSEGVISEKPPLLSHEMTKSNSPLLPTNDSIPRIKIDATSHEREFLNQYSSRNGTLKKKNLKLTEI